MLDPNSPLRVEKYGGTRGGSVYIYSCTCGGEIRTFRHRIAKHTGLCSSCSRKASKNKARPFEWLYLRLKREASKRGHEVTITWEEFLDLTEVPCCQYCNGPITWTPFSRKGHAGLNLDRKDNSKGYTSKNIAVCCFSCNTRKSNWMNAEEFQATLDLLKTFRRLNSNEREGLCLTIRTWT